MGRQWICHHERWRPQPSGSNTSNVQEVLGVDSGSGIFTQSGGVNVPYAAILEYSGYNLVFTTLQLGYSNGGYGEYDMSGGSLGVNAIYVGGNTDSQMSSAAGELRHGSVQPNGRIRRLFRQPRAYEQCHWSGGGRQLGRLQPRGQPDIHDQPWDLHPRCYHWRGHAALRRRRRDDRRYRHRHFHPELRNQRHRRRRDYSGNPGGNSSAPITTPSAPSFSAGITANKERNVNGLLWQCCGDVQPQRRTLDRWPKRWRCHGRHRGRRRTGTGIFNQNGGTNDCSIDSQCRRNPPIERLDSPAYQRCLWNLHPQPWAIDHQPSLSRWARLARGSSPRLAEPTQPPAYPGGYAKDYHRQSGKRPAYARDVQPQRRVVPDGHHHSRHSSHGSRHPHLQLHRRDASGRRGWIDGITCRSRSAAASMCTLDMNGRNGEPDQSHHRLGLDHFNFANPTTGNDC